MLTISNHNNLLYIKKEDIDEVLYILYTETKAIPFEIIEEAYETSGKHKQLHYHSLVKTIREFRYKPFTSIGGFSLNFKRVKGSLKPCINYIYKDQNGSRNGIFIQKYAQNQSAIFFNNTCNNENVCKVII